MKRYLRFIALGLGLLLGFASCEKEKPLYTNILTEDAMNELQDVQNGINGAYSVMGSAAFLGREVVALGDMCGRTAMANPSTGHWVRMNNYAFDETAGELSDMWTAGYRIVDATVRTLIGAKKHIEEAEKKLASDDPALQMQGVESLVELTLIASQCHSVRALVEYYLVNIYSPRYSDHKSSMGIVLVPQDRPFDAFERVARATVEESYASILDNIQKAEEFYALYESYHAMISRVPAQGPGAFYMQKSAILALKCRVALTMERWDDAIKAGEDAALLVNGVGLDPAAAVVGDAYKAMWSSLAIQKREHIFLIAKSNDDNLSANALNTLYGSYGGETPLAAAIIDPADARFGFGNNGGRGKSEQPILKWGGIPGAQAVNNIPIFRLSEVALNVAEAYFNKGDEAKAQQALYFVAQRDPATAAAGAVTATGDDLFGALQLERIRELYSEGFDLFDLRRWGGMKKFEDGRVYKLGNFAFPIPFSEISAGFGVVQNPGYLWQSN